MRQVYRGTKDVYAEPMTRGAYNTYRGWTIPSGEEPNDPGYLVEYLDGGLPNVPGRTGYVSWSPAEVFERAYKPVPSSIVNAPPYLQRVVAEKAENDLRLAKLVQFLENPANSVTIDERERMFAQAAVMRDLSRILGERLTAAGLSGT